VPLTSDRPRLASPSLRPPVSSGGIRRLLRLGTLLAGVFVSFGTGCGDDRGPSESCGDKPSCGRRAVCDNTADPPACVCAEGYDGTILDEGPWDDQCTECAEGYRRTGPAICEPIPIDCGSDPCGVHGTCQGEGAGSFCVCDDGYGGRLCDRCAHGYQDNDDDGTCEATCELAETVCPAYQMCSDESGSASCECPEGTRGEYCDLCAADHQDHDGDGTCQPACGHEDLELECGDRGFCSDESGLARCECDLGFGGGMCSTCADGWVATGSGGCRAEEPEPRFTLMAITSGRILVAIDPAGFEVRPLVALDETVQALAADVTTGAVYGLTSGGFAEVDRHEGTVSSPFASPPAVGSVEPFLTWDGIRGVLYFATRGSRIDRIDPGTGVIDVLTDDASPPGTAGAFWVRGIAHDDASGNIAFAQGSTDLALYRWDVAAAEGARVGDFGMLSRMAESVPAPAHVFDPSSGALYGTLVASPIPEERAGVRCRELARGFGHASVSAARSLLYMPELPGSTPVASDGPAPEVICVASSEGSRAATVSVDTRNPGAVVVVSAPTQPITVRVTASASFGDLILDVPPENLTIELEAAVEPDDGGAPRVHAREGDWATPPHEPPQVRYYDSSDWAAQDDVDLSELRPVLLYRLDKTTGAATELHTFAAEETAPVDFAPTDLAPLPR